MDNYGEARRRRHDRRAILRQLWRTAEKHYVREFGWLPAAQARCQRIGRPLRYFTLAGEEALDILHFYRNGLIHKSPRGFPDLGLCELYDDILAIVMQKLKFVGRQRVGKFEDVAREPDFSDWFRYDVVNLDFTGVPFPTGESPFQGTWGAIEKVVESQAKNRQPFDLFLTFNGDARGTDQAALFELLANLNKNLDSQLRKEALERRLGTRRLGHLDTQRLLEDNYPEFMLIALPKLMVGLAVDYDFECPAIRSFYYERVGHEVPYKIVKFVFSLEFPKTRGKSLRRHPQPVETYEEGVLRSFSVVPVDVDAELRGDPQLREKLENEVQALSW